MPETNTVPTDGATPAPAPPPTAKPPKSEKITLSGSAERKGNIYYMDPALLLPLKEMNARRYGAGDVKDLVREFLDPRIGQLEPVGVKQTKDGPAVVYGGRRHAAALEINENGLHGSKPPFRIICISVTGSDDETYLKTVAENNQRQSTSPIDDAYNIDRLLNEFIYSREEVAKLYGKNGKPRSQSWITQTLKLLDLAPSVQKKVHSGELPVSAAYELAEADTKTQKQVASSTEKVTKEAAREATRESKEAAASKSAKDGKSAQPAKKKETRGRKASETKTRSSKEVKRFVLQLANFWTEEKGEDNSGKEKVYQFETFPKARELDPEGTVKELGSNLLKWLEGKMTDKTMCRHLLKFGGMID